MTILLSLSVSLNPSHRFVRKHRQHYGSEESGLPDSCYECTQNRHYCVAAPLESNEAQRPRSGGGYLGLCGSAARCAAMLRQNILGTNSTTKRELLFAFCSAHWTMDIASPRCQDQTTQHLRLHPKTHARTHLSDRRVLVHRHGDLARRGLLSKIPQGNVSVASLVLVLCVMENASHPAERGDLSCCGWGPQFHFFLIFTGFPH